MELSTPLLVWGIMCAPSPQCSCEEGLNSGFQKSSYRACSVLWLPGSLVPYPVVVGRDEAAGADRVVGTVLRKSQCTVGGFLLEEASAPHLPVGTPPPTHIQDILALKAVRRNGLGATPGSPPPTLITIVN